MLKALEDVWLGAVVLCPPVLTLLPELKVVCSELVEVVWLTLGDLDDSEPKGWVVLLDLVRLVAVVWTEAGELVLSLALVDDWTVPVVCCDVVGRIVLPELVATLPVPVVCPVEKAVVWPVEEAVPLVLRVTRLALEVCTEPVDREVLLMLTGGLPVPVVCPGAVERTLPPVLVACPVPVVCSEAIEELLWLALGVLSAPAEVMGERVAVVCCEAADVLICPLVACSEGAEVVVRPVPGGA